MQNHDSPPFTAPPYVAPDGPRWLNHAEVGDVQIDGRGVRWVVDRVETGGRVVHWWAPFARRYARTEVTSDHPDYPSDEDVATARAARARAKAARWR